MSVIDAIKNSVLESFDTSLTPTDILAALAVSLLAGLFILVIYRYSMRQVSFNRSFCMTLLLVTSISAMMVLTITSNLALSLGMVGALSIVRFRSAIKDVSDTAFLFWAVAAGITAGAGYFLLTLIGCLTIGAICLLSALLFAFMSKPYLLVVRTDHSDAMKKVEKIMKDKNMRCTLSAMTENAGYTEVIYDLAFSEGDKKALADIRGVEGVIYLSLVDCRKN